MQLPIGRPGNGHDDLTQYPVVVHAMSNANEPDGRIRPDDTHAHGFGAYRAATDRQVGARWVAALRRTLDPRFLAAPLPELALQAVNAMPGSAEPEIGWQTSTCVCVSFAWRLRAEPDLSDRYLADFGLMRSWVDLHCRIPMHANYARAPQEPTGQSRPLA
ncbi:hypothetical protein [Lysobacter antibioticus]|uniref:Uncharacterized protein n=1 Tax=Lysobacter antibioticus TaxID=84531 RepID=A0A0S2F5H9_LYSAN|nr:hypothetical protein [Lysobacter antibioticus]ALN78806.1 hypothetical protein LA76x_0645 [Lysobacter antibioticus]